MTYPISFRRKVLEIRSKEQLSMFTVAKRFGIDKASVIRWSKVLEPQEKRYKPSKIDMLALSHDVEIYPDSYLHERAARFKVSHNCIWHALKRLRVTYKKNSTASQGRSREAYYILPKG